MGIKSDYEWFWVGKPNRSKKAVEEWLHTLDLKYITKSEIAKKYNVSLTTITNNLEKLEKQGLITLPKIEKINTETCVVCNKNPATQIHHLNYNPEVMIDVCTFCHTRIHKKGTGIKEKPKRYTPFLRRLPYIIELNRNDPDYHRKYMQLYREWNKNHNSDEVKIIAQQLGLQITELD